MVDALASGLPLAQDHLQVLERLKQLTAWQQAQQERLRRHQQEQIARLRGEQERLSGPPAAGLTPVEHGYTTAHPSRVPPQPLAGPALSHSRLPPTPACTLHPMPPTVTARNEERGSQLAPDRTVSELSPEDHEATLPPHAEHGTREGAMGGRGCEASSDSGLGTGGHGSEEGSLRLEAVCSDESSLVSEEVEQFSTLEERGGGGAEKPCLDVSYFGSYLPLLTPSLTPSPPPCPSRRWLLDQKWTTPTDPSGQELVWNAVHCVSTRATKLCFTLLR